MQRPTIIPVTATPCCRYQRTYPNLMFLVKNLIYPKKKRKHSELLPRLFGIYLTHTRKIRHQAALFKFIHTRTHLGTAPVHAHLFPPCRCEDDKGMSFLSLNFYSTIDPYDTRQVL